MTVFSDKRLVWGSLLLFSQQGATIAAESFINFALIDTYEPRIFVYFYALAAIASSIFIALSQLIIRKYERPYAHVLYGISILSFLSCLLLTHFNVNGVLFATTINLITALDLIGIANNTSIFTAFNIQELHRVTRTLTISSCIATIFFCILLPVLISNFGATVLLFVSIATYAACWLSIASLKPLAVVELPQKERRLNPLSFPLFRLIILYSVFSWASLTFIDYAFKMALMQTVTGDMVGIVSAVFLGFVALAIVLTQVLGAPSLVERFGGLNLLTFAPIIVTVFGTAVIIFPHVSLVFLLYFVQTTYVLGVCYVGSQMLLNSVPRQIQFRAQSLMLIVVLLVSDVVIVPTFFFSVGESVNQRFVVAAALVCLAFSLVVLMRVKKLYPNALKSRLEQPRFIYFRNFVTTERIENEDIGKLVPQIGHRYSVESALVFLHHNQLDPVPFLTANLPTVSDAINFQGRVRVLARLPGESAENHLAALMTCRLAILPNALPYAIAMRSLKGIGDRLRKCVTKKLGEESEVIFSLKDALAIETSDIMLPELAARLDLAKRRFFYYLAAASQNPRSVMNVLPLILDETFLKTDQIRVADAIDYLGVVINDSNLRKKMNEVLLSPGKGMGVMEYDALIRSDHWLSQIRHMKTLSLGGNMNETEKALFLSRVQLFEPLPAEILESIASSVREETFPSNSRIFTKGDEVDKAYMVVSGNAEVRTNQTTVKYERFGLFGELGMLGRGLRTADAVAMSDVKVLVIEKQEFLQMLEDVPEIAKGIIKLLTGYLERASS